MAAEQMAALGAYLGKPNLRTEWNAQKWEICLTDSKEMMPKADPSGVDVPLP